jgi:hypothetical protein
MLLVNVLPALAPTDLGDGLPSHSELPGDLFVSHRAICAQDKDRFDLILREFCAKDVLATGATAAFNHPTQITGLSIGHQMRRPNAANAAPIAEVSHIGRLGWRLVARRQDVGNDVSRTPAPLEAKPTVAIGVKGTCPYPAGAKVWNMLGRRPVLVNLLPEPLQGRTVLDASLKVVMAGNRAEVSLPDIRRLAIESLATCVTRKMDARRTGYNAASVGAENTASEARGRHAKCRTAHDTGTLNGHRDHSSVSDPGAVVTGCVGVTSCLDFTTSDQMRRVA